ncbi:protein transport protein Sec31A-like [Rhipicephalus microplus]|uniref:protein transport protein Sec31A-like n=1 Tax=Rhipicephalus microplus TaxID=6941 RepID=UPI003F6AA8E4
MAAPIAPPLVGGPAPDVPEAAPPTFQGGYVPPPVPQFSSQPLPSGAQALPQQAVTTIPSAPPKEKGPIPEKHQILQEVFERLRVDCYDATINPQTRRKLRDVARKLENLYDKLREGALEPMTRIYLHDIVRALQENDYKKALWVHGHLAISSFQRKYSFVPALETLLELSAQLGHLVVSDVGLQSPHPTLYARRARIRGSRAAAVAVQQEPAHQGDAGKATQRRTQARD